MANKSISGKRIDDSITSDDILGKDVIDSQGGMAGVVEKIFVDPITLNIVGIEVDKGIMHKGLTIGTGYIKRITPHAIFLNTSIVYEIKGMTVFDVNGSKIGKVKSITLHGSKNVMKSLTVGYGLGKRLEIPREMVELIGDNVMLNISKAEAEKLQN